MAMNQVQFQRELSMAEFVERYGSEHTCKAALAMLARLLRAASLTPPRPAALSRWAEEYR